MVSLLVSTEIGFFLGSITFLMVYLLWCKGYKKASSWVEVVRQIEVVEVMEDCHNYIYTFNLVIYIISISIYFRIFFLHMFLNFLPEC